MVLRIWLTVLLLFTLYYGSTLYGDSFSHKVELPRGVAAKFNHDD